METKINIAEDKKQQVLDAALQVFSEEGFHKAKITKIAELAGIGAGTVYLYFQNKQSILEELFLRSWLRIEQKLIYLSDDDNLTPKGKIRELLHTIISLMYENKNMAIMFLHEYSFWSSGPSKNVNKSVDNAKQLFSYIIKMGVDKGDFRSSVIAAEATAFIIGGLWYFLALRVENLEDGNIEKLKSDIEGLVFQGIL